MRTPGSADLVPRLGVGGQRQLTLPGATWLRTRDGRRYAKEIALILVVKLVLLVVLWLAFAEPWPRGTGPAATVVQGFYVPLGEAVPHD